MSERTTTQSTVVEARAYLDHYGLRSAPFRATVDPRLLWIGRAQREALATLTAAIRHGHGVLLLTGDAGTGKSSLVRSLVERLSGEPVVVGRLADPAVEMSEVVPAVARAFGIQESVRGKAALAAHLGKRLSRVGSAGRCALLVVDDGQALTAEVLRELCDLSELALPPGAAFTTLLAGHTDLGVALARDESAAPGPSVTTRCVLGRLTHEEVGEYVESRLALAGATRRIFDEEAIRQMATVSRGALGMINVVGEHALLAGYRRKVETIGRDIVEDCLGERASGDGSAAMAPQAGSAPRSDGGANEAGRRDNDAQRSLRGDAAARPDGARQRARAGTGVLLVVLAAAVAAYGIHLRTAERAAEVSPRESTRASRLPRAPDPAPAIAMQEKPASQGEAPSPGPAPARGDGTKSPPEVERRDLGAPPPAPTPPPRPPRAREQEPSSPVPGAAEKPRASESQSESPDPGAVIDWLLEKSGKR